MLNKRLNPFAAIFALTVIGAVGTFYVVQKIFDTDFTYSHENARVGVTAQELLKTP